MPSRHKQFARPVFISMMIYYTMHSSADWLRPHERSKYHVFHSYLRTTPQKPSHIDPLLDLRSVLANCVLSLGVCSFHFPIGLHHPHVGN